MEKTSLYLECNSGISGDMLVAALIDLGVDADKLKSRLYTIPEKGFKIEITDKIKSGLKVKDFNVVLNKELDNHDADMNFLFGNNKEHNHHHHIEDNHHHHIHRGIKEVFYIIDNTDINENVKSLSKKIFNILGKAEAKAHGTELENVHFHEVGAIDSIIDIIGIAICMDELNVEDVIIPVINEGCGTINCAHGTLSIPVPAVVNIIADSDINITITNRKAELITPTGAAAAAAIQTHSQLPSKFKILKIGMGAGKREYEIPSILRAMLIMEDTKKPDLKENDFIKDCIYKLETNIDDGTGENLGYVMNKLLENGALDIYYSPIYMKKSRPAYTLNVICKEEKISLLEKIIFKETTTIGIRYLKYDRHILKREIKEIKTSIGLATVKICFIDDEKIYYPEYESVVKLTHDTGKSFNTIYNIIKNEAGKCVI